MTWETGASLVDYGLRRANELGVTVTGEGDFEKDYRDYINLAYWDIVGEFPWLWANKYPPYNFTTSAAITASGTLASRYVVTIDIASPEDLTGWKLIFQNDGIVMRIASQSGANLTLATQYPKTTAGGALTIYKDEYQLPLDVMLPLKLQSLSNGGQVDLVPQDLFIAQFGRNESGGTPTSYTHITSDRIQLGRWPPEQDVFELWYTYVPPALDFSNSGATDTPIMPLYLRWTIADRALFYLLTDMDDNKAALAVANSSERLKEEKNRQSVRMAPQWWIPRQFRLARGRF